MTDNMEQSTTPIHLSVAQFTHKHPAYPVGTLRDLIFFSKPRDGRPGNGFEDAFLRLGRKVLIDEERFFECVANQARGAKQ